VQPTDRAKRIRHEVQQAADRFGWDNVVRAHALLEALHRTDQDEARAAAECVSRTTEGVEVRCPAWPKPCTYVRMCQGGFEIGYWRSQEWRDRPEDVAGAIFGALAAAGAQDQADEDSQDDQARALGYPGAETVNHQDRHQDRHQDHHQGQHRSDHQPTTVRTYVLGRNERGDCELLGFDVPVGENSPQALLEAEHHATALNWARRKGLRGCTAFDEHSPAAGQARALFQEASEGSAQGDAPDGREPMRVVLLMNGDSTYDGAIPTVWADRAVEMLLLDSSADDAADDVMAMMVEEVSPTRPVLFNGFLQVEAQQVQESARTVSSAFEQADRLLQHLDGLIQTSESRELRSRE